MKGHSKTEKAGGAGTARPVRKSLGSGNKTERASRKGVQTRTERAL